MICNYRSALITGASAGLGVEFARQLLRLGVSELVLVARREERLLALREELLASVAGKARVLVRVCDLESGEERQALVNWLAAEGVAPNLLVNNAGFGSVGEFLEQEPERQVGMVQLNCVAPLELTGLLLPSMVASGSGAILNVASTASFQPLPYMSTYAATKAFLLHYSLALSKELEGSGVQILCVCPGPTRTEFHLAAGLPDKIDNLPAAKAEDVVRAAIAQLNGHSRLLVTGTLNRLLVGLARRLPLSLALWIAERTLRRYSNLSESRLRQRKS